MSCPLNEGSKKTLTLLLLFTFAIES